MSQKTWRELWYENAGLNCVRRGLEYLIPDEIRTRITWQRKFGVELNLVNPVSFNEKLQWLKLRYRNPLLVPCSDKYSVREFVSSRIGTKYLNELYGVFEDVDQIDFRKFPEQFVLKATHGSEMNVFCRDRQSFDEAATRRIMRSWLATNYYWANREWWYKRIQPRIVCEKYLIDESTRDLRDYKFLCFDGRVGYIWVDIDRFTRHRRNFYDLDWRYRDVAVKYPTAPDTVISRPRNLYQMIELASVLSKGFPHVRVDFYNLNDRQVLFGELTYCSGGGLEVFSSPHFAKELGDMIDLPDV